MTLDSWNSNNKSAILKATRHVCLNFITDVAQYFSLLCRFVETMFFVLLIFFHLQLWVFVDGFGAIQGFRKGFWSDPGWKVDAIWAIHSSRWSGGFWSCNYSLNPIPDLHNLTFPAIVPSRAIRKNQLISFRRMTSKLEMLVISDYVLNNIIPACQRSIAQSTQNSILGCREPYSKTTLQVRHACMTGSISQ